MREQQRLVLRIGGYLTKEINCSVGFMVIFISFEKSL